MDIPEIRIGGGRGVNWFDLGQDRNSECSDTNL